MYIWEFQIVWTYVYLFCTPDRESKGELLHRFPRFFNDFWCNECYVTTSILYIFLHGEKRCYFWCFKYFITILFPLTLTGVRRFRRYCRHNAQFSFIIIFIKLFVVFLNEIHDSTDNCRFTRRLVTRWRYVPNATVCFAFLLLIHTTTVNSDELVMTIVLDVLGDHGGDILDQVSQWFPGIPGVLLGRVVVLPVYEPFPLL